AGRRFVQTAIELCRSHGFVLAHNSPYAGGYLLDRHSRPGEDIHALQIEVSRAAYLDSVLDRPGPGLARVSAMLSDLCEALAGEAGGAMALAAE
ncbi:MAG: N-formylglutamate amidohydrolase, partial [Sphingomonadales bacterium]|nr:N-formylglutamate amidohydrolase [Sphingomonadales bacterium]